VDAAVVTVGDTPTLIATGGTQVVPNACLIRVPTGGSTVYLGGPTVTADAAATGGFPLASGESFGWDLIDEDLYGIVSASTQIVRVARRNSE
jgi:hypothetical protein